MKAKTKELEAAAAEVEGETEAIVIEEEIKRLPIPGLKAKDLQRHMLPMQEILRAYQEVGEDYEVTGHDRCWKRFYFEVTANKNLQNQRIEQSISSLNRVRYQNKDWLTYGVALQGKNWKGNTRDFYHMEGYVTDGCREGLPIFHRDVDPMTDEVISGTTQMSGHKPFYTIPFTKEKVDELSEYFTEQHSFSLKDNVSGRRYTCTLSEFRDLPYEELINLRTGLTDYLQSRQSQQRQKQEV
jgi:hypothetical protein